VVVEPATFLTRSSAQVSVQRKDANLGHQRLEVLGSQAHTVTHRSNCGTVYGADSGRLY
jgi:hypothetical protein